MRLYNTVAASGVPAEDVTFELLEDETTSVPGQYYMGASRLRLKASDWLRTISAKAIAPCTP